MRLYPFRLAAFLLVLPSVASVYADWPTYRHDAARSGVTRDSLAPELHKQWSRTGPPPRPAWPEPGRELNRLAFDYVDHVAVVDGAVFYGSSADHQVHCVDLDTGRERWTFFTEGPIRFAPTVSAGRVYVASDDGRVYCLTTAEGRLLWDFRPGPAADQMMGNEQLVSRWPLRTGVAVVEGVVYLTAGMWPTEGVYLYALRADTGEILWRGENQATDYKRQPHPGSFAMLGVAPQGPLVVNGKQVIVPTGRNAPAAYDRATGRRSYFLSAPTTWGDRWGGTWNMAADDLLLGWRAHVGPDMAVMPGEYAPHVDDGLIAFQASTGKVVRDFPGGMLQAVVDGDTLYACGRKSVAAYDLKPWRSGAPAPRCTRWSVEFGRAYEIIKVGDTLVVGGAAGVATFAAADGRKLWETTLPAQARGLAAAAGKLLVGTTDGRLTCFGADVVASPPTYELPATDMPTANTRAAQVAQRLLAQTGKKEGHCLVLGAGEGGVLLELAKQSELILHCVEPDPLQAARVRRTLAAAGLYGARVTVQVGSLSKLTAPDYLADAIVVPVLTDLDELNAEELYRVLHPLGGRLLLLAQAPQGPAQIREWLVAGGVPSDEIEAGSAAVRVTRGALPDSDNWTHQYATAARTGASNDHHVKLPLKLLWFGKPGPAGMVSRHWGGPAPLCVDGRLFVIEQFSLTALDAYNGRELWKFIHPTPVARWPIKTKGSSVAADHDGVYFATGNKCLRLDPATGKLLQTYQVPAVPGAPGGGQWSHLAIGEEFLVGSLGTEQTASVVFAIGKDGTLRWTHTLSGTVNSNSLSVDEKHVYLIDRPDPKAAQAARRRGETAPTQPQLVALDVETGQELWRTGSGVERRTALWLSEGILLATSGDGMTGYDAATGRRLYTQSAQLRRFPVLIGDTVVGEPTAWDLRTGQPEVRRSAFTGEPVSWNFLRSYGCGAIAAGPNLLMFRSGTLGFYDLAGDSGVHNFAGVRAGCYVNAIAANGLVLAPPGDAACTCSYNFQTTVALAPTTKHEEWSIFFDHLPTTTVKRLTLNLGAPGDHREASGDLWVAAPRPQTRTRRDDLFQPFRFELTPTGGAYYHNADHTPLQGTDKPWLYTNGLRGLRRAELDLEILNRGATSWPTPTPPTLDGALDDDCWDGYRPLPVETESAQVQLRHDADNLYIAYRSPRRVDETGKPRPWRSSLTGRDAAVWKDDSCELFLSGAALEGNDPLGRRCLHLGVSASGAQYDALWKWVQPKLDLVDIPKLEVVVDGDPADWGPGGLIARSLPGPNGRARPADNFDPSVRLAWTEEGLLLLVEVADSVLHESTSLNQLWKGDSVEVFLTTALGSGDAYQVILAPGLAPAAAAPRMAFYDFRKKTIPRPKLTAQAKAAKTATGYVLEALLPWKNLGLRAAAGLTCGIQVLVSDQDNASLGGTPFLAHWHPVNHPVNDKDPSAYQPVRLAAQASSPLVFKRSAKPGPDRLFAVTAPPGQYARMPAIGAEAEDAAFNCNWKAAARADGDSFVVEMALPWAILKAAELNRAELMLDWRSRGPLNRRPTNRAGYERVITVSPEKAAPRELTVRLHFAETEGAAPGERLFDVKLQGKTVLTDLDIVREAGGPNRALVKQFQGVEAARALVVELTPKRPGTEPLISALELVQQ